MKAIQFIAGALLFLMLGAGSIFVIGCMFAAGSGDTRGALLALAGYFALMYVLAFIAMGQTELHLMLRDVFRESAKEVFDQRRKS